MQIRSSKNSCMGKENRLYSISLGVASLQGGLVGVATALSPATCRPFQVFSPSFFVGLGLNQDLSHLVLYRTSSRGLSGFVYSCPRKRARLMDRVLGTTPSKFSAKCDHRNPIERPPLAER